MLASAPLSLATWPAYAELIERHNGVFGGCWCMGFHAGPDPWARSPAERREAKRELVEAGRAQAGLVFDGETCIGWCQFGAPQELTRIKNRKAYEAELASLPDWRITCLFVDKTRRRQGIAALALEAALAEMARCAAASSRPIPRMWATSACRPWHSMPARSASTKRRVSGASAGSARTSGWCGAGCSRRPICEIRRSCAGVRLAGRCEVS